MPDFITVSLTLPASMLTSVYALLAGYSGTVPASSGKPSPAPASAAAPTASAPSASVETAGTASTSAALVSSEASDGVLDAGGWPWSADMHASTKALTGAGLWRMKPGVARPENKPGFTGSAAAPGATTSPAPSVSSSPAPVADEDEFAAFRNAAGMASTAAPTARTWADADLSKLCNQAAVAKGSPEPVKAIIAKFVPAGEPAHSRSIPTDQREAFAVEVETTLGIVYEG